MIERFASKIRLGIMKDKLVPCIKVPRFLIKANRLEMNKDYEIIVRSRR